MTRKDIKVGSLITHDLLVGLGASCDQLGAFDREWPNGCRVRLKNLLRAAGLGISVAWFASGILSGDEKELNTEYGMFWYRWVLVYRDHGGKDDLQLDAARALWDTIKERGQ